MMLGNTYNILKQLGIKGLILVSCVIVGLVLILIVPTFAMKLLGIGVVILSILGLIISFYQRGYVTGKEFIVEKKKPSTPLPKNLKIDEIRTEKGKIKSFENVETDIIIDSVDSKPQKKSPKKKFGLVQGFINFVAKAEEKSYFPSDSKLKTKKTSGIQESDLERMNVYRDEPESSFKIIRKSKTNRTETNVGSDLPNNKEDSKFEEPLQEVKIEIKEPYKEKVEDDYGEVQTKEIETDSILKGKKEEKEVQEEFRVDIVNEPKFKNRSVEFDVGEVYSEDGFIRGEPIKEMKILFERMLNVIGTVTKTITAAFYLVNKAKNELVLQAIVSHNPEALRKERKIPLDGDLISQIVYRGRPEIIDFNPYASELDLLPYYSKEVGARTFIGVPLTMRGSIIGVLCADSTSPDAFDNYTMNFFLHYAKIFSFFLESYTEKYELLLESQALGLVDEFRKGYFAGGSKVSESMKNLVQTILNLFDFTTVGICLYDFNSKFYRIYYIRSKKNLDLELKNKKVDLKRTLLGKSLSEKRVLNVEFDEHIQRVHYLETKIKRGNFVAVPIKTQTGVYGAVFGWTDELNPIINNTIRILEDISFTLGLFYENDYLNFVARSSSKEEVHFGKELFHKKVEEEWKRAVEFGIPFSICKISIDNYLIDSNLLVEFESQSRKVVQENLQKVLKDFEYFADLEDKSIGVVLIGRTGKDAKLLFEMIRKNIAQTMLKINNENVFFTISVGIAQFNRDTNVDKLIENVDKALEISCSRKNTVTLY
ncbi:MAG: GAF domain-containing protein [Ignavibacteria bacterium]|nr:GAF domain-containing protein [Ignavibacteria bacterium]